jgi:hypothetical protein
MSMSPGDLLRTTIKFTQDYGSQIQNVFHFILSGTGAADEDDVTDAIISWLDNAFGVVDALMSPDVTIYEIAVKLIEFFTTPTPHWSPVMDVGYAYELPTFTPAATGDKLPPGVSAMVRYPTGYTHHEKRTYLGGFTEAACNADGQVGSTATASIATYMAATLVSWAVPNSNLEIIPCLPDVDQELYKYYDQAIFNPLWHYQRRRQLFVGI